MKEVLNKINGKLDRVGDISKIDGELIANSSRSSGFVKETDTFEPLAVVDYFFEGEGWSIPRIAKWFRARGM